MSRSVDCAEAQDHILQRVDGESLPDADGAALDAHLAGCAECARFELQQLDLARRLRSALPPAQLSPDFRAAVRQRIDAAEPKQPWLDVLPDYAHLVGCAAATAVTVAVFPAYTSIILSVAAVGTALTYVAQTMLASALDEMETVR